MSGASRHAAMALALDDWPVLPLAWVDAAGACSCRHTDCRSPGKHPLTARGVHDASMGLATVEGWFNTWPSANIGLVTGAKAGVVVLDVDDPAALESLGVTLPSTVEVSTGRCDGARHLYFAAPTERITSRSIVAGIDLRGEASYVVVPPSRHASGEVYEWVGEPLTRQALAPFPSDLLATCGMNRGQVKKVRPPRRRHRITQVSPTLRIRGGDLSDVETLAPPAWRGEPAECRCRTCGKAWQHAFDPKAGAVRAPKRCRGCGSRLRL